MMDVVKEMPIHSAVELQGAVLGRHEEEIFATRHAVESLAAQITDLTNQLRHLQSQSPSLEPRTTSEPKINNPPCYSDKQSELGHCAQSYIDEPRTSAEPLLSPPPSHLWVLSLRN
ncbi:arachidonate 5-lipoxygenase-like protein [Labeo rohita]|uniref:Arachidonate 5-lipoxygenase-like protein n=1 Tax=Labeo rohita TaxID=84645 RepID=A0A498NXT8_LABRO|nr:arachidonate 5-lipoxygenase-like protein [Labeo rohita]